MSDEPGTTRDIVEVALGLGGLKVVLSDTAGIREPAGRIEQMGIDRARERAAEADLIIELVDPENMQRAVVPGTRRLVYLSKADLLEPDERLACAAAFDGALSARTGEGIATLVDALRIRAQAAVGQTDLVPFRERHVQLLRETADAIRTAADHETVGLELRAEHLRRAADRLGRIAGSVDVEDLLGVIFSSFCVGK